MQENPRRKISSGAISYSHFMTGGFLVLAGALIASMMWGAVTVPGSTVIRALIGDQEILSSHRAIVVQARLPRTIMAALVGAGLSLAGAAFQGLFRNPLAGPYVLGVSSGASFGAVLSMVLGIQINILGVGAVPTMAFAGALLTIFVVYNLSRWNGEVDVTTMLLAGIAISAMFSALISLLLTFAREHVIGSAVFWMMGGLSGASWARLYLVGIPFLLGSVSLWFLAQPLNAFLLGEEEAHNLGVNISVLKKAVLVIASLLTASAVAASGAIGFVGLIVPHAVRAFVGPDHRRLLPGSAVVGAGFLILADTAARTVLAPMQLQVGILTALLGGPFFIYILKRHRRSPTGF